MPTKTAINSIAVSAADHQLLQAYADVYHKGNMSDAIRQLLKESPRLIAYAEQCGVPMDAILVTATWGGDRHKKP